MSDFSVTDAQLSILAQMKISAIKAVDLHDSLGRVLAKNITANRNHPPYDVSAMDGYAVIHADIATTTPDAPISLSIVDDIRAGQMPKITIGKGQAARIMTGAPTPAGIDTVIRVEDTTLNGDEVAILTPPQKGANIRPLGENLKTGHVVLTKGTLITPGVLAILAMVKQKQVPVFGKPTVAILSTGDELEAIDEPIDENKIPNANSHALYAQCKSLGIEATLLGIAKDDPEDLRAKLTEGLRYDVLLASGGVSVGHHDFVRPILDELGITFHFWRVAMRPGHPLAFGTTENGTAVFGLPGNPVASMVCFEEFVGPALRAVMGHKKILLRTVQARLPHNVKGAGNRTLFIRVTLELDDQGYVASLTGAQGSGVLMSMALAEGLMIVPADSGTLQAGDMVTVQLLQGMDCQSESDL
ncbi:MAG: molybdopterin molybdotransferase MoeA [Mariprofundus sp.]|nr:molybdopterin molybdotransferase MoeA [Mariprofundus sp.]